MKILAAINLGGGVHMLVNGHYLIGVYCLGAAVVCGVAAYYAKPKPKDEPIEMEPSQPDTGTRI